MRLSREAKVISDPRYYLANFHTLLDTLKRRDADLLLPDELRFMADFAGLPIDARALLVRMLMRKGPLFRASGLRYAEIPDLGEAAAPLLRQGFAHDVSMLTTQQLFHLFSKAEIIKLLRLPARSRHEPKPALLARANEAVPGEAATRVWQVTAEKVYGLDVGPLCDRLRLMFFGNFRQTLTDFVLADLGVFKYEIAGWQVNSRPFQTRRQVEDFHRLYVCRELLHGGAAPELIEQAMPAPRTDCDWLDERRDKLSFQIARAYERAGVLDRASALFSTCRHPEARSRLHRLREAASGAKRSRERAAAIPTFDLALEKSHPPCNVERSVRDHLALGDATTQVHYVENGLVNTLFGLLCWPAVFAPVPGAFFHGFHRGPADLATPRFVERRAGYFEACFNELESGAYRDTILRRFADKHGIASPFVAWGFIDGSLLQTALECLPACHLRLWFEWMLRDIRTNRTGFPDLVQFWPSARRYRLIEIKAPGDRLQVNQRACLEFMLRHDMPVTVCRVRWRLNSAQLA